MLGDDKTKKRRSLVDDLFPNFKPSDSNNIGGTSPSTAPSITDTLLPDLDENTLISKLQQMADEEEKREKVKVDFSDNSFGYTLPVEGNTKSTFTRDVQLGKRQEPTVLMTTKTGEFRRVTPTRLQEEKELKEAVKNIGDRPGWLNALSHGVWQGVQQNVEMVSGFDLLGKEGANLTSEYELTYDQLNELLNTGIIDTEDMTKYLNNRNALPLLTTLTASIVNSALLAAEIGFVAPEAAGIELTQQGAKFFTKEALKKYGKELVKEGWNSYKVLGPGANIRAGRNSYKEIEEVINQKGEISTTDALTIIAKNALEENVSAYMEGMSEGMLRNIRYKSVPLKDLLFKPKKAWLDLASNMGAKSINGLFIESATEQVTDIVSDIFSGNNVFTQGTNAFNIFLGETDEIKRQALENLFVEGVTGFVLGSVMGKPEVVGRNFVSEVQDLVDTKTISLAQGQALIELAQNQAVAKAVIDKVIKKNQDFTWKGPTKQVAQGLDVLVNFGLEGGKRLKTPQEGSEYHQAAIDYVDQNEVADLAAANNSIEDIRKKTEKTPNLLDRIIEIGRKKVETYLESRGKSEGVNALDSFRENDTAFNLPFELQNKITGSVIKILNKFAADPLSPVRIDLPSNIDPKLETELSDDLTVATFLNFSDKALDILRAKWTDVIGEGATKEAIDSVKSQLGDKKAEAIYRMGRKALSEAMVENSKDIDQYYGNKAFEEAKNNINSREDELDSMESAGDYIGEMYSQQPKMWRPYAVAIKFKDTGAVLQGLPGMMHAHLEEFIDKYLESKGLIKGTLEWDIKYREIVEDGFIDFDGTYYTRDEVEAKNGIAGEAYAQGLVSPDGAIGKNFISPNFYDQMPIDNLQDYQRVVDKILDLSVTGEVDIDVAEFIDRFQLEENKKKLEFEKIINANPVIKNIVETMGKISGVALTGSLSLSIKGELRRDSTENIHDLDYRTDLSSEQISKFMEEHFPNAIKVRHINFPSGVNDARHSTLIQYMILPSDTNIKRSGKGNILEIRPSESGSRPIIVDFFVGELGETYTHKTKDGSEITVAKPYVTMAAKVGIKPTRQKDINDIVGYFLAGGPLHQRPRQEQPSQRSISFTVSNASGYSQRTKENASADATIAIAVDFTTRGEMLTKKSVNDQGKKYIAVDANNLIVTKERVDKIVNELNSININKSPNAKGKMTFSYGNNKRNDVTSTTTFEAIKVGERTATTRYESDGHINYWKDLKTGDVIEFEGQDGEKILVQVTRPLHKLIDSNKTAEQWSKLEGWSINYFNSKVKPRLNEAWQIEYKLLNNKGISLNIAGNGLYTMRGKYSQEQVDNFTYELLKAVLESPRLKNKIESIRSGGQTGFDEAGAKAGMRLGIPTTVHAPKGWTFRPEDGKDYSNERAFKERFSGIPSVSQVTKAAESHGKPSEPITSSTLFGTYNDVLKDFQGGTLNDLFNHIKDKGIINEALLPVYKIILKHAGDFAVRLEERKDDKGRQIPGGFQPSFKDQPGYISINPATGIVDPFDPGNTILHEAFHAFTVDFMRSGTKEAAEFRSDIEAVMKDFLWVVNNPKKAIERGIWTGEANHLLLSVGQHMADIKYYVGVDGSLNTEEFIAGVFADVTKVRGMLMRIKSTSQKPTVAITLWDKVRNAFKNAWKQVLSDANPTLFDTLVDQMSKHQTALDRFHKSRRKDGGVTPEDIKRVHDATSYFHGDEDGFYPVEQIKEEDIKKSQEEDEIMEALLEDAISAKGLFGTIATLQGTGVPAVREHIRGLKSRDAFKSFLDSLNLKYNSVIDNKITDLYNKSYNKKTEDEARFKDRLITGIYNTVANTKAMPHVSIRTEKVWMPSEKKQVTVVKVVKLGDVFKNGDGTTGDSYTGKVLLEGFLGPIAKLLGLSEDAFKLQYIANFENYKDGKFQERSTLDKVTEWLLGMKKGFSKSARIATMVGKHGYIYMGNFGGRNTTPVLFVEESQRAAVNKALLGVAEKYGIPIKGVSIDETSLAVAQAFRLLLEDTWFAGTNLGQIENIDELIKNSTVLKEDINKIWKRGMKFLTKVNVTWEDPTHLSEITKDKKLSGIKFKDKRLTAKAVVFNSEDGGMVPIKIGSETVQVPISLLLKNTLGTQRTDGASFYLIGEFDEVYHEIHGTTKDGVIKNVYASSVGNTPMYIKHAMHGVSKDSPLGRFMLEHDIALLVSDSSAKIPMPSIKLSEHWAKEESNINPIAEENQFELPIGDFQRIGESLGTNTKAGTIKQWLNGSGHGRYNPAIDSADKTGKYDKNLQALARQMVRNAQEKLIERATPDQLRQTLKDIIASPNGPRETLISTAFRNVVENTTDEEFADHFGNIYNFPMVAESLRQRLLSDFTESLKGRIAGMRLILRPDTGYLNKTASYDLINESDNLDKLALAMAEEEGILSEIYPEKNLAEIVKNYLKTQRLISIHTEERNFSKVKELNKVRENLLHEIDLRAIITGVSEERKKTFIKARGNIYKLINRTDKFLALREKALKQIIDPTSGTINKGWSVIPEDLANKQGLKVGDKFIAIITPTDSPLGILTGRVAAIAPTYKGKDGTRKVADRGSILMNSEYIQTLVGKDFDIDSISIVSYHPDYWDREQYKNVWDTIDNAYGEFTSKVVSTFNKVLGRTDITERDAFSNEKIREDYMKAIRGESKSIKFNAIDNFWDLNDAYLTDVSKIISERLLHTALSAIGMKFKFGNHQYDILHEDWFRLHLSHLIDTNFSVDFPGKTNKLTYFGPDTKVDFNKEEKKSSPDYTTLSTNLFWNADFDKSDADAINEFMKMLTGTAFDLASGRDLQLGEKPDYYRVKEQIKHQQLILNALGSLDLQESRDFLLALYVDKVNKVVEAAEQLYGPEHPSTEAIRENADSKIVTIRQLVETMEVRDIENYPLFASILAIDTNNMPVPGTSYYDWMIDQNLIATDMLYNNAQLAYILETQINAESTSYKKSFFTRPDTFIEDLARRIIQFVGSKKGKGLTAVETLDQALAKSDVEEAMYISLSETHHSKLTELLKEYSALRSLVGKPYPANFIRGGENWNITHRAIALSLLPKQLDFTFNRGKIPSQKNLQGVQLTAMALLHAFQEKSDPKSTKTPSDMQVGYWYSRSQAFPRLIENLLSKDKVTTESDKPITLKHKGKEIEIGVNSDHILVFKFRGLTLSQSQVKDALTPESSELKSLLTKSDGLFSGIESGSEGLSNRFEFSKLINFNNNIKPEERIGMIEDYIRETIYSPSTPFNSTDRAGFWISFMSNATNEAIEDKRLFGFNIRRDKFVEEKAMNYRANEVFYQLLNTFEPQLFNRVLSSYSYLSIRGEKVLEDIGIKGSRLSSDAIPEILNQAVIDHSSINTKAKITFDLVRDEINSIKDSPGYFEFNKVLKTGGFNAGMTELKKLISNTKLKQALASSEMWFGDLVVDVNKMNQSEFTKKYGTDAVQKVHDIMSQEAIHLSQINNFVRERVIDEGNDKGALRAVFVQLKALDKLADKTDNVIKGPLKKLFYGKLSYNLIAPIKEKKIFAFDSKDTVIGRVFGYDGIEDLTVGDMESFNKSFPTTIYEGVGLSSVAMRKSQVMNTTLNRHHTELGGAVQSMEHNIQITLDPEARREFLLDNAHVQNVPRVDFLKRILPSIEKKGKGPELLSLRKDIFNLAEDLKRRTGIQVMTDDRGEVFFVHYSTGIISYDKYEFLDKLNYTPETKLRMLAALDIRELYDAMVPKIVSKALNYIEGVRNELINSGDTESLIRIDTLKERYMEYLFAIAKKNGAYLPHMFTAETAKFLWVDEYRNYIKQKVEKEYPHLKPGSDEYNEIFLKAIDEAYSKESVGETDGYTIPNFMPRKGTKDDNYKRATLDMHFKYIGKLITGIKQDLLFVDWVSYTNKARANGERSSLIQLTNMWYADQTTNRTMHTKNLKADKIKPGMEINFLKKGFTYAAESGLPLEGDLQVWGKVKKIDKKKGIVQLDVNKERILFDAKRDLQRVIDNLSRLGFSKSADSPAMTSQLFHIKSMVKKGYITPADIETILGDKTKKLTDITRIQALTLMKKGLEEVIKNIDKVGQYKIDDLYVKDLRGRTNNEVKKYTKRGALEYLDAKRRESSNLRNVIGEFDRSADAISYYTWSTLTWGGKLASVVPKTIFALMVMGLISAPKALTVNTGGAYMANLLDAPITNRRLKKEGKKQWAGFYKKSRDTMNQSQRQWYDLFVSMGLATNRDLVAISLEAGNISTVDVLSDMGFVGGLSYLVNAWWTGTDMTVYNRNMTKLKEEYILAPSEVDRLYLRKQMEKEYSAWKAQVEKRIKDYVKETTPTDADIAAQKKLNPKLTDEQAKENARREKVAQIAEKRSLDMEEEIERGEYKEITNLAHEEMMNRITTSKIAGKFLFKNLITGYVGLGLQALAEVQRRPAFYIGWRTAKNLGYTDEEAIQYGIASVEYRHAFYGPGYKQFDANTKFGSFLHQYVQYNWNSFVKWIMNIRSARPQIERELERVADKNFFKKVWHLMFKRTYELPDAEGKMKLSRDSNTPHETLAEVNVFHRLLSKFMLNMMVNQASARLFYGLSNHTDPMIQLFYKVMDVFTDKIHPNGDDDDDNDIWFDLLLDSFFFLGPPYKLAAEYFAKSDDESLTDVYLKGRIEDELVVLEKMRNEIDIMNGDLHPKTAKKTGQEGIELDWFVDSFLLGFSLLGTAYPDSPREVRTKWGYVPSFDLTPPFMHLEREARQVRYKNKMRYIDTGRRGVNFSDRFIHRMILEAHKTFIPYLDKFSSDYKPRY